jgi:hypothetical protein
MLSNGGVGLFMSKPSLSDIAASINMLIDGWCERRALSPLRKILGGWPPPNGFSDEWRQVWAALRLVRAMDRADLVAHGELEELNRMIAGLSTMLFPQSNPQSLEDAADRIIAEIFGADAAKAAREA